MKQDKDRPQKGARKILIDNEAWWYLIGRGGINIPIWDPSGKKTVHTRDEITPDVAVTPWDMRLFIDRNLRSVPEYEIEKMVAEREARLKKERDEYIANLRKSVLDRARELVYTSNEWYLEYHGGDEIDLQNRETNKKFLEDLAKLIAWDPDKYHEKPKPKKDSWD